MNCIIFSKDRALQLDALLRSIYEFCDHFSSITVLYTTRHKEAYRRLKTDHPSVDFVEEQDFREDFLILVGASRDRVCLLVDDCLFFRDVDIYELLEMLEEVDIGSLRLGNNITKKLYFKDKSSLDGNIFPRDVLMQMEQEQFTNPNQLEIRLKKHTDHLSMAWFDESRLIGIPSNKVSDTSTCSDMGSDTGLLNGLYLQGYRIEYRAMELSHNNVHKNEHFIYKKC